MGIVSDIPLRQFVPEAQSPSALETPSMTDGPVAVGSAPTLVTVGKGCKARPVEVGEVAASSPPGTKSAKPPASLEEAAPTAVTFGWVGAKRVLCVSSSSSGSGVSALGGAAAGRGATGAIGAGAGAGAGAAALGAGVRERSDILGTIGLKTRSWLLLGLVALAMIQRQDQTRAM